VSTTIVKCHACGATQRVTPTPGKANPVSVEHESACPFLHAIEKSHAAALKWVEAHGYPITFEAAS
jgi:hypothetical protein